MAEKLVQYYEYISRELGLKGAMKLAAITGIPSIRAQAEPDSEQNLTLFRHAVEQLTGKPAPIF